MSAGAGPLRVLVVDDEPAIRRFLRAGLASQGYVVSELEDGLPAVDIARRKGTDLSCWTLGCRTSTAQRSSRASGPAAPRCRSSCCPAAATKRRRLTRWTWAPMT